MKNPFFSICAAAMAVVSLAGACQAAPPAGFIRVRGVDLVDANGTKFCIRGTNVGHWLNPEGYIFGFGSRANSPRRIHDALCELAGESYVNDFWRRFVENYITRDDIRYIASTGATTVRVPFHYKLLCNEPYLGMTDAAEGFSLLDRVIGWCRDAGLRVILDMHDCPGGQTGDNIDDSYGYPWLFEDEEAQRKFVAIWQSIAERYADEPAVLGYDLMNEPIAHYFDNREELIRRLEPLLIRASRAIRKKDPNHILIFAGAQWNTRFEGVYADWTFDDNLMYTCHIYKCPPESRSLAGFVRFRDACGRPMYMGETGENTDEWVGSFRRALDAENIGWTFWTYKRLDTGRSFVSVPLPEHWQAVADYVDGDRSTFAAIRERMPDRDEVRKALEGYLEACRFENCRRNEGYVSALGLNP